MGDNWQYHGSDLKIVSGNKFTTVPKNAKTDRGICIEPSLNIFLQLGIGAIIRDRLSAFGFSLEYQEKNQKLAQLAFSKALATIDFSNASDTIAWSLVRHLISDDWFELLEIARSPTTEINGVTHTIDKFSSMGNGFTFELESLIFLAIALAVVDEGEWTSVSIYGDDLIVPQAYGQRVIGAFTSFGLSVNEEKSYLAGSFFESCGKDYFNGFPVRGFFLEGKGLEKPYALQIANKLRLYAHQRGASLFCDKRYFPLWKALLRHIPKVWRSCRVPPALGDTGLISSYSELKNPQKPGGQMEGFYVSHINHKAKKIRKDSFYVVLAWLNNHDPAQAASLGFEPRRGFLGKLRKKSVLISEFPDGFDWSL
jgi:hypothetical protein